MSVSDAATAEPAADPAGEEVGEVEAPADETLDFGSAGRWLWLAAVAAVLALVGAAILGGLTLDSTTLELAGRLSPWFLASLGGLMLVSWLAASARVLLLARGLGHRLSARDAFVVAVSGEFGVAVSPAAVGGTALRLGFLKARGLALHGATAVVAADIALDAVAAFLLGVVAIPALLLFPGGRALGDELVAQVRGLDPRLAWAVGGLLLLLLLAGMVWRWWQRRCQREAGEESESRWTRLRCRFTAALGRVRTGLAALLRERPRTVVLVFLLGLLQFGCRYSIMPLSVLALDPDVGGALLLALFPLQAVINGIAHAAVLPGGGGSAELGGGLALAFFLPAAKVVPAVLLWRLFTFHWNVFLGGAVFLAGLGREVTDKD